MHINRREFMALTAATTSSLAVPSAFAAGKKLKTKVIAFDAFTIFDIRPIAALAENLFPEHGLELEKIWRTRLFEYCWLRSVAGRYADFWKLTQDALTYAAKSLKVDLNADQNEKLMQAYLELKAWPDVLPVLTELKEQGIRMAFLANITPQMLDANVKSAGLGGLLDPPLTAEAIHDYKPSPRAYRMAMDTYHVKREEVVFVAFGAWDVAGAKWFGYPTYWANRGNLTPEQFDVAADIEAPDFSRLIDFAKS